MITRCSFSRYSHSNQLHFQRIISSTKLLPHFPFSSPPSYTSSSISYKRSFSLWRQLKQYIKPDPMYEIKENLNKMLDDSMKELPGGRISHFFFRTIMKKLISRSIDESSHQIQWILQIKTLAEEIILQDIANQQYFGSKVNIYNVTSMKFNQLKQQRSSSTATTMMDIKQQNYFELTCPIRGDDPYQYGSVYLQGYMDVIHQRIIFYDLRTYNARKELIAHQTFDEEDQKIYYQTHPHKRKIIDIKGVEVDVK